MYNLNTNNLIVYTVLDLKLFDKEFRSTQLVFSYQGGKKVSEPVITPHMVFFNCLLLHLLYQSTKHVMSMERKGLTVYVE